MKHILFCSGGKDSTASLILAKEHGEPIDEVVFVEVMFTKEISGEHPLHRDFVYNKLKPFVENELGIPFVILHSDKTYTEFFHHQMTRGKSKGIEHGFPIPGMCAINRDCKLRPIRKYQKSLNTKDFVQYVGIASDEPIRLKRLEDTNKVSLLDKYGYTEQDAYDLCKEHDLLSPVYELTNRNGCWFCMNCKDGEFRWLLDNRPDLFNELVRLEEITPIRMRRNLTRKETPSELKYRLQTKREESNV